jgi:hypothetical protein
MPPKRQQPTAAILQEVSFERISRFRSVVMDSNLPCGTGAFFLDSCHDLVVAEGAVDQARLFTELVQVGCSLGNQALAWLGSWGLCGRLPCGLFKRRRGRGSGSNCWY